MDVQEKISFILGLVFGLIVCGLLISITYKAIDIISETNSRIEEVQNKKINRFTGDL